MSLLAMRFREEVSKLKDYRMKNEAEFDVGYPTRFLNFDFKNGTIVNVKSSNGNFSYYSIGIIDGSMNTIIGRSGSGKTTWAVQSAANIIRNFTTSCMYIDSVEGGITKTRLEILTGFTGAELRERIIDRNTGVTAENFYERVKLIHDIKMANRADFEYVTGFTDGEGNPISKLEPTVYILDSLAMLMPETYTTEESLSGQMAATSTAKTNGAILKRLVPMLKSANIILFIINHINQKVEINPMQRTKAQVSYLKAGETLPGGNAAIYLANNIIRFDDVSKIKATEGFGIDGSLVDLTLVKSRTNKAGQSVTLVFNQDFGFDQDLSLFLLLKTQEKIGGAGRSFYIGDRQDLKFAQKNFKEKLMDSKELRDVFTAESIIALQSILTRDIAEIRTTSAVSDVSDSIMGQLNSAPNKKE